MVKEVHMPPNALLAVIFLIVLLTDLQPAHSIERILPQSPPRSSPLPIAQKVLPVPGNLTLSVVSSSRIDLRWNVVSANETGFAIERKIGNSHFTEIGRVGQNDLKYSDENLSANTKYTYRIRSFKNAGYSPYCDEKTATTLQSSVAGFSTVTVNLAPFAMTGLRGSVVFTPVTINLAPFTMTGLRGSVVFNPVTINLAPFTMTGLRGSAVFNPVTINLAPFTMTGLRP